MSRKDLKVADIPIHDSLEGDRLNIYDVASFSCDHIVVIDKPSNIISKKLLEQPGISRNKKKLSVIKYSDDEMPDYFKIAEQMDDIFKKVSN